jgi:hypothetical protein
MEAPKVTMDELRERAVLSRSEEKRQKLALDIQADFEAACEQHIQCSRCEQTSLLFNQSQARARTMRQQYQAALAELQKSNDALAARAQHLWDENVKLTVKAYDLSLLVDSLRAYQSLQIQAKKNVP